jgi:hypothetical protein
MNDLFAWRRLGLLIRNDFVVGLRTYLTVVAVTAIIMILHALPTAGYGNVRDDLYDVYFAGMILIWGTIHASLSLSELADKRQNENFLLLPASALEKTLARYLNSSIFFIFYVLVYTTLAAFIIEGVNMLLFNRSNGMFNPFSTGVWELIAAFMIIQPIFFLGGAIFRRFRWFKTIISVFIIAALLVLLACMAFLVFFGGDLDGILINPPAIFEIETEGLNWRVNETLAAGMIIGLKVLFYFMAPIFCCYVAWLRVKETQVSYGV